MAELCSADPFGEALFLLSGVRCYADTFFGESILDNFMIQNVVDGLNVRVTGKRISRRPRAGQRCREVSSGLVGFGSIEGGVHEVSVMVAVLVGLVDELAFKEVGEMFFAGDAASFGREDAIDALMS